MVNEAIRCSKADKCANFKGTPCLEKKSRKKAVELGQLAADYCYMPKSPK